MAISEGLKKLLESASEDERTQILSELEGLEKKATERDGFEQQLSTVTADRDQMRKDMFSPEFLEKLVGNVPAAPAANAENIEEWDLPHTVKTLRSERAELEAKVAQMLDEKLGAFGKGLGEYLVAQDEARLKRDHSVQYKDVDYDKDIRPQLVELAQKHPEMGVYDAYDLVMRDRRTAVLEQEANERAAAEQAEEDRRKTFAEKPEAAIASLQDMDVPEGTADVEQIARDVLGVKPGELSAQD